MATDLAPVTAEVMRWARESVGASKNDAAKRAGVTVERISAWEDGTQLPTLAKLRALARLYQRPVSVFFLPAPPRDFDVMRDFRRLPESQNNEWSRPLHKAYRRAVEQQEIMIELLRLEGDEAGVATPSASLTNKPEETAQRGRRALAVTTTDQHRWSSPEDGLAAWIAAAEALGILVLRTSEVPADEMRGFSLHGDLPVIMINALDPPRAQIFTLLHEFAHLMLGAEGVCDLMEPSTADDAQRVEIWCNAVAASIAMPRAALMAEMGPLAQFRGEWDESIIEQMSLRWSVSQDAVLRRLVTLELASQEFYVQKRAEYREAYRVWRDEQREERKRKKTRGGPPPYRMVLRDRGRPYVRLALDAYHQNLISTASLTRALALKAAHIPALEREAL